MVHMYECIAAEVQKDIRRTRSWAIEFHDGAAIKQNCCKKEYLNPSK